jgi:hypothetical protein
MFAAYCLDHHVDFYFTDDQHNQSIKFLNFYKKEDAYKEQPFVIQIADQPYRGSLKVSFVNNEAVQRSIIKSVMAPPYNIPLDDAYLRKLMKGKTRVAAAKKPAAKKKGRMSAREYVDAGGQKGDVCDIRNDGELKCLVYDKNGTPYWAKTDAPQAQAIARCGQGLSCRK